VKDLSDNPGYGFVPSPESQGKKELPEVPKTSPAIVNNFFTVEVNLQVVLFVALLVVLVLGLIRLSSIGLRA